MSDEVTAAYRAGVAAGRLLAGRELGDRLAGCCREHQEPGPVWRRGFAAAVRVVAAYAAEQAAAGGDTPGRRFTRTDVHP